MEQHAMKFRRESIFLIAIGCAAGVIGDRLLMRKGVTVYAQEQKNTPVLTMGSESVSIGMPRETVLARFADKYKLLPFDGSSDLSRTSGTLIVMQKDDLIGTISFRDGKLINAERAWGSFYT
jgi:hypothetical protein